MSKLGVFKSSSDCLTFDTQEQFNLLCSAIDVPDDSIVIDGKFCCYLDHQGVPDVQPINSLCEDTDHIDEALSHMGRKEVRFKTWKKRIA